MRDELVGIGRHVSARQKTTTRKRGDTAVCDDGCLSSRSARFIRDLNRHSVRSNDIGSPNSIWQRGHGPRIRKEPRCAQCWGGDARRSGGGGGKVHAGIGYFANQKGGGTGPGRGRHSDPFWVACLLACLLSRSLRLSLLDLHLWTHFLLVPFRVLFSPSLSLHSFTPLRLVHRAESASLSVPVCCGTTPAPSPSPTLPRLPRKISHKHFTHAPQKEGPWTLPLPVRTSEIPYRRSGPHQGKPSRVRPPHRKRSFCALKLNPRSTGHPAQFWDPRPTTTRPPPPPPSLRSRCPPLRYPHPHPTRPLFSPDPPDLASASRSDGIQGLSPPSDRCARRCRPIVRCR